MWTNVEFQFKTTTGMWMATKSSDLDNQISGTNLQIEGHTPTSPSGWKGLKDTGASGTAPPTPHPSLQRGDCHLISQDPVLSRNMCSFNWRERSCVSTTPHLDGTSAGGHATTWQDWPHWSISDRPRKSCPLLWETVPWEGPELRWGERCWIYTYGCWYMGL